MLLAVCYALDVVFHWFGKQEAYITLADKSLCWNCNAAAVYILRFVKPVSVIVAFVALYFKFFFLALDRKSVV